MDRPLGRQDNEVTFSRVSEREVQTSGASGAIAAVDIIVGVKACVRGHLLVRRSREHERVESIVVLGPAHDVHTVDQDPARRIRDTCG